MHLLFLLTLSLVSETFAQKGYSQVGGRTRLDGSSFGVPGLNKTFDYIVVGGGTAGLAVAERLAENAALSIAVIEAGGFYEQDNGNISQIPALAVEYSSASPATIQPSVDWGIVTPPQAVGLSPKREILIHRLFFFSFRAFPNEMRSN